MRSPQPMQKEPSLEEKLAQAKADNAKWAAVAVNPKLSPQAAVVAANAARSSRAAMQAWQKALAYQQGANQPEDQLPMPDYGASDPALLAVLGLNLSPPGQPQSSVPRKASSSTKLGTSDSTTSPPTAT